MVRGSGLALLWRGEAQLQTSAPAIVADQQHHNHPSSLTINACFLYRKFISRMVAASIQSTMHELGGLIRRLTLALFATRLRQ